MTMRKGRGLMRWAMAGCGLAAGSMLAMTSAIPTALAADIGRDAYVADDGLDHTRKSRGSGHTFDVAPHPQSVSPYKKPSKQRNQHAYRERPPEPTYDDYGDAPAPAYGSLKDDIAPDFEAPQRGHQDRWRERDYADRSAHPPRQRWSERHSDRWAGEHAQRCIPKHRLRRQLRRAGWRGFRRGRVRGNIGYMVARQRRTGEIYELAVDRCTGDVISASCIGPANRGFGRKRFRNRNRDYREDVVIRW